MSENQETQTKMLIIKFDRVTLLQCSELTFEYWLPEKLIFSEQFLRL